ncbi:signal peptidase complex subunit 2 [Dipodascopsis tothii]|uniref:signal peptidase complex subunit 2 n=1 Tax=Dipodascopsis tothii TaxID=44089 RepID=UPI0034CED567
MTESKQPVNLMSTASLKAATDDEIAAIFGRLGYKQSFLLMDVRLVLGFASVAVAAAVGAYGYLYEFEQTKFYTSVGVVVYFVLNLLFTAWSSFVEKGVVYEGVRDGQKISVASSTPKYQPTYEIRVRHPSLATTVSAAKSYTEFFDAGGVLVTSELGKWLEATVGAAAKPSAVAEPAKTK